MKKITFLIFFVSIFSLSVFATSKDFSFKVGYYAPSNLKSGIVWGVDYGYAVDEAVSIGIGADLYYRTVKDIKDIGEAKDLGVTITASETMSEWKAWHLPILAKVRFNIPMSDGYEALRPFLTGGLGYGITHVSYTISKEESTTYTGFVWQIGGGAMYRLGGRSNFLVEIIYNGASFDKDESETKFTTLDSSGVMFRVGINVQLF